MRDVLSGKQVQDHIGIHRCTLDRWLREGLPSHKVGGKRLYVYSEVLEWIKSHDRTGKRPIPS
mgnify:CR=1 FL=1